VGKQRKTEQIFLQDFVQVDENQEEKDRNGKKWLTFS